MRPIDEYFENHDEPNKSCLQALRSYLLSYDALIAEAWKYRMPFYLYNGTIFCYLWVHKKYKVPYIGIVVGSRLDHPDLLLESRNRMKILLIDPTQDIPVEKVKEIFEAALNYYRK